MPQNNDPSKPDPNQDNYDQSSYPFANLGGGATVNPNDFVTETAKIGLTSSIDEYVHLGREQFMTVFEEAIGSEEVLFQVECDINGMLEAARVFAPHNDNVLSLSGHDSAGRVSSEHVHFFERLLKSGQQINFADTGYDLSDDNTWNYAKTNDSWTELQGHGIKFESSSPGTTTVNSFSLQYQMRRFLSHFFDKDQDLNAIYAQPTGGDFKPSALTMLDDERIRTVLRNVPEKASESYVQPTVSQSKAPKDRANLATNLLSNRQLCQVLESFAALGLDNENSRVIRATQSQDTNGTMETKQVYKYRLHKGDSIIGETRIYDSDAINSMETEQKQVYTKVKIQLVQSETGAYDKGAEEGHSIFGGESVWNGEEALGGTVGPVTSS